MTSINDIKLEIFQLLAEIDTADESDIIDIVDRLREVGDEAAEKLEFIGYSLEMYRAAFQQNKERMERLKERNVTIKNTIERLNSFIVDTVKECGGAIDSENYSFKIINNNPSVDIENEMLIPKEYTKEIVTDKLDKKMILIALKSGKIVPGCKIKRGERVKF